jgi:tRNA dimethylallyltransferase
MAKPEEPQGRMLCLAGATATGKSEIALLLAERLRGEIISVDSMQVYRGLDIGTAKPGAAERARVPHHLIDVAELNETFDAAQFARLAKEAVREIQARGRLPILCGGTGLYFKAFLEGLGDAPPADAALRAELEAAPLEELLRELEKRDPVTFAKIDRQNPRRVIRALEVIRLTGKPFSEQRAGWGDSREIDPLSLSLSPLAGARGSEGQPREVDRSPAPAVPRSLDQQTSRLFGVMRESGDLHARINARVDFMFRRGLVEEVRELLKCGLAENRTAMQAIGYRQVVEHLRGEHKLPETIELVKIRTRQFAKRQMTWFRRHAQLNWVTVQPEEMAQSVAGRIVKTIEVANLKIT